MGGYTLGELALAYELRQEGCCWKRIAQGLGGDHRALSSNVSHCVLNGIKKGLDGYRRQPGRPATFDIALVRYAAEIRRYSQFTWAEIGESLGVDSEKLRKAHQYAKRKRLL